MRCTAPMKAPRPPLSESGDRRKIKTFVDLIPTAAPTPLARRARAAGATVVDGLPMLLQQAASSFRIWTGQDAPVAVMRAALYAGLS